MQENERGVFSTHHIIVARTNAMERRYGCW